MTDLAPRVRHRRAVAPRVVFLGLVASFAMAGAVAVWIYARYVAYERIAAQHVHDSAAAVVRIDLEQVVTYEPFRRHLLPLVTRGGRDGRLKPRLDRLKHHTRVELGVDVREIVYASGPDAGRWSLALGGVFPKSGVPRGLHRVLDEEGIYSEITLNALQFQSGARMTQAADGVIVLASDAASLSSAATAGNRAAGLGLPNSVPVAVALDAAMLGAEGRAGLGSRLGLTLDGMRIVASLVPDSPMRCEVTVQFGQGKARADDVLRAVRRLSGLPASKIQSSASQKGTLELAFPISSEHLDEAARALAEWLTEQLSLPE
jgi:hypothetical protein